jgi:hypothetical protein
LRNGFAAAGEINMLRNGVGVIPIFDKFTIDMFNGFDINIIVKMEIFYNMNGEAFDAGKFGHKFNITADKVAESTHNIIYILLAEFSFGIKTEINRGWRRAITHCKFAESGGVNKIGLAHFAWLLPLKNSLFSFQFFVKFIHQPLLI